MKRMVGNYFIVLARKEEYHMQYAIIVQRHSDGSYQASVPLLPGLIRIAPTRDEVLQLVRHDLAEALTSTEVVYVHLPEQTAATTNPWLDTAGMFRDDRTLEPLLEAIYAERDAE
jgi:predicted RNase H-like HicB family nuclease